MDQASVNALLRLDNVVECTVVERLNRFVVKVFRGSTEALAHTNNTGSLRGVLERGRRAYCLPKASGKTGFRLVAVECPVGAAALIDTTLQMRAFEEALARDLIPWLRGCRLARRNPRVGDSVLDYLLDCGGRPTYVEVKSAVLRLGDGTASYPEPASARGRRHVRVLTRLSMEGYRALLVFIAAIPGSKGFRVNSRADPLLPRLLLEASLKGVVIKALSLYYDPQARLVLLENPDLPVLL